MPKYCYYCESCKAEFEISHSIKEKLEKCDVCGVDGALEKLPSIPTVITKGKQGKDRKVGAVVKEYIKTNREQLEQEKEKLKKVEY